jgi:hypothetical protein
MACECARVAQLDRVTASGAAGCGFNSRRAHHFPMEFYQSSFVAQFAQNTLSQPCFPGSITSHKM